VTDHKPVGFPTAKTNVLQHIHDLLITRAEKAAEKILVLEYRIKEM
jgi:hypothetical protein